MIFKSLENVTALVPFIPDLLQEESHSIGNAYRMLSALFGTLVSTLLLGISSQNWVSDTNIYLAVTASNTMIGFYIIFNMKDIINSQEFKARRKSSNSESKRKRCLFVTKQAWHIVKTEPYIPFSIVGGICTLTVLNLGNNTTVVAINDAFKAQHNPNWEQDAKYFYFWLKIVTVLAAFPPILLFAALSRFFLLTKLLLVSISLIVVSGGFLVHYLDKTDYRFQISFMAAEACNAANFVLLQTMLQKKMQPDSRGTIIGL